MISKAFYTFRRMKIRQKILFLIIMTVFISNSLIFFSSYTLYINSIKSKAEDYSNEIIGQILKNTDSYFKSLESIALSITFNTMIQDSIVNQSNKTDYDVYKERSYVENALKLFVFSKQYLQISIFNENGKNTFYTSNSLVPNPDYNFRDDEWYKKAESSKNLRTIVLNNPQSYFDEKDRKDVHTFIYRMIDMYTRERIGYILMDIDKSQFEDFFKNSYIDIENIMIVNEDNEIVYSRPQDANTFGNIVDIIPKDASWGHFDKFVNGRECMVLFGTSEYTKWKIISVIPYYTILKDVSKIKFLFFLIPIILFFITVIISWYFSLLVTNPIERLKEGMARIKRGQFQFSIPIDIMDETGEMIRDFNSMTRQIDYLMKKNETIELLRKETEMKALQQQINPHFLYNTLEMVIGLASEREFGKIISVCKNLGNMFRYNLSNRKTVLVEEEINQVKSYISIMKQRFEEKFDVDFIINPDLLKYKTLKFILQPFAENSISHGFSGITSGGLLIIRIDWSGERILFLISDNGIGMPEEVLEEIRSKFEAFDGSDKENVEIPCHLGIINVYMRLKLTFGDDCRMSIDSAPESGTTVRIEIPPFT